MDETIGKKLQLPKIGRTSAYIRNLNGLVSKEINKLNHPKHLNHIPYAQAPLHRISTVENKTAGFMEQNWEGTKALSNEKEYILLPNLPHVIAPENSTLSQLKIPASPQDINPLHDLLGEELVHFLDPNYVTKDDDTDIDYDNDGNISNENPLLKSELALPFLQPITSSVPSQFTVLHHQSVATYQYYHLHARLKEAVYLRVACVPGTSQTKFLRILDLLGKTIIFDVLEWKLGTRLIGCCSEFGQPLNCPFSTPLEASSVIWQIAKFECAAKTDKIIFICENYGSEHGFCAVDSVRLHRSADIFFLEPCQKNLLSTI
uniref:Tudor domain-containing protein n=1 Tax=Heterorhabditis bacteriophora TaxID=37862 RepID=A0A1I7XAF0_HETBA